MPVNGNGSYIDGAAVVADLRRLSGALRKSDEKIAELAKRVVEAEKAYEEAVARYTHRTLADRLRLSADREVPFLYNIEIVLTAGSTARVAGSALIEQEGAFLLRRIAASFRPTSGSNTGRWMPISSDDPAVAVAIAGGTAIADGIDFVFDWTEGMARRGRNDNDIPGSLLYRHDQDGILPCEDVFLAASTVEFGVTPLRAPANTGVLVMTLIGTQLLSARV